MTKIICKMKNMICKLSSQMAAQIAASYIHIFADA